MTSSMMRTPIGMGSSSSGTTAAPSAPLGLPRVSPNASMCSAHKSSTCGVRGYPYPGREPIGGGTGGYTWGWDQSEEGREDIPGAGTNTRRDGRIYRGREPIGGGTGGYTRGGNQYEEGGSQYEEGREDIPGAGTNPNSNEWGKGENRVRHSGSRVDARTHCTAARACAPS
eukprot:1187008-Prorocentrum_minimum.AAC.4